MPKGWGTYGLETYSRLLPVIVFRDTLGDIVGGGI